MFYHLFVFSIHVQQRRYPYSKWSMLSVSSSQKIQSSRIRWPWGPCFLVSFASLVLRSFCTKRLCLSTDQLGVKLSCWKNGDAGKSSILNIELQQDIFCILIVYIWFTSKMLINHLTFVHTTPYHTLLWSMSTSITLWGFSWDQTLSWSFWQLCWCGTRIH